jgi:hypothetical protein
VTPEAAELLVASLAAAFPWPQPPEGTTLLYVNALLDLDERIAARVVKEIIATETRWPPLGLIQAAYRRAATWQARDVAETHGLPEPSDRPPLPDEVRAWVNRQLERAADRKRVRQAARARLAWQDTTPLDDIWPQPSLKAERDEGEGDR